MSFQLSGQGSISTFNNNNDKNNFERISLLNQSNLNDCPSNRGLHEIFSIPKNIQTRRIREFRTFMEMTPANVSNSDQKKPIVRVKH